mgnify:CR=1 FL=1
MQQALRQTISLWVSLLILGGLTFFILRTAPARAWMWQQTGEEDFLPQVKGLTDLASDLLRPRLALVTDAPIQHADVNPFGINAFLEQEVDPAKRERAVQMAAEAGFHWLRQEFTWEDIEIHGKGDFEDRRHEPYRSAWDKYDQIVDLAEQYEMELIVRISNPPEWTRALTVAGLDPLLGYYHQPRFGRPALALDLMEEFRPIVGDSVVLSILNTAVVSMSDFVRTAGAAALKPAGRKRVIHAYERRMDQLVTHPVFGYRVSYRRVLEVQARLFGRFLLGEIEAYPEFRTR